jgi:F0F1-type ATP synthase epsilon subunit
MAVRQDASTGQLVEDKSSAAEAAPSTQPVRDRLTVKVWSPFKVYFDGEAQSVSGVNATGPFDVLPRHHSFISLLSASDLLLRTAQGDVRIRISGGLMRVHADLVTVFLEV